MNSKDFTLNIIAALNKQLSKRQLKSDLKSMDNSMSVKILAKLTTALSKKQLKNDLKKLNDLYVQIGANVKVDKNTKNQLQKRIKELQNTISEIDVNLKVSKSKAGSEVDTAKKAIQAKVNKTPIGFDIEVKRSKAIADIEYLGKRFSKLFTNVAAKQKYENILMSAYSISDENQLRSVRNQIAAFTSELKANGLASQTLGDKWRNLIERSKDMFSAASVITMIFSQVRQSVSTFLQLDSAMTNLYKVQDQITNRDQFSGLLTKWNKLAQNLAVTTDSLINSAAEWSKIGFNLDMSEQLAQITAIFEKTAEISNEKANSTLVSAAQAFTQIGDLGEDDYVARVEAIGDRINAVGNKYSISSEGIADGLQNASAALRMAGNDLDEAISLITATNKIFQSPEEGSNMLKVASMRLRGQVDALKEMGEDAEGLSTDITKIQQQIYELTGNKVNIFEDEDTLKSTYQMILEIGEVFDSLTDRQQADLLETMFGKQRASAGASLLLNYEELEKIKNDSMNAAGSMAQEYSKYMESAEAHITIFKEKLVETYSTFMSGDLIKYTADVGSGILDLVNSTDLLKHSILAVLALNVGKGITSFGATIATTVKEFNTLGSALQQIKNLPTDDILKEKALEKIGESTKNLTEHNLKLLLSQKQLEDSDKIMILNKHSLTDEEAQLKLEKMGLLTASKAQSAANVTEAATAFTLKNAMISLKASIIGVGNSLKAAFLSNPIGFTLMAVTTIIGVVTTAVNKYKEKLEEANETTKEAINTFKSISSEVESLENKLSDLNDQISKLDPITDEEDIQNLKLETAELETQLAILKEKQRIAQSDADKAAQESLSMTQASRYQIDERESAYGGVEIGAAYVTKDKELLNAIRAYDEYKALVDEANKALADMAETGEYTQKEWRDQEQLITKYSERMEAARSHANELASTLSEQKQGLSGNTEASQNLLDAVDSTISTYDEWLNKINGVTVALKEQGDVSKAIENITANFDLSTYKESIDTIQSSLTTLRSALESFNKGELDKIQVLDLMQEFPSLVPYIDLTADGFGNLSEGLSMLISQQPDSLIQSLQSLKESLSTDEEREQVELLIDQLQRLSSYGDSGVEAYATTIGNTWDDTANVIEGVTTQFENLAKVQEAVADGLTMSANAAAELAKMYPEILTNAQATANGQITLNEEVVSSILDGDKSIIDAQIAKLEANKAELIGKEKVAEAQLDIIKQVGEGEGNITKEVAQYRIDIANQLLEKLIEAGMDEDKAYAAVAENMAGNMDEYNRIVSEVAQDTSINMDKAAVS